MISKPLGLQGHTLHFFEISSPYLIAEEVKMSLTAFLMHSFLGQNTPKSYHNMTTNQE